MLLIHGMVSLVNIKLWIKFIRNEVNKEIGCEVMISRVGLATTVKVQCTHHKKHSWELLPRSNTNSHSQHSKTYDINCLSILAAHCLGFGWSNMTDFCAYLGLGYMGQHAYENVEKYVGLL